MTVAGWAEAWGEAQLGLAEGGVPIGAALVRTADGVVLARGRNQRHQRGDITAHAEVMALRNAGLIPLADLRETTLVSTLIPCAMCAGTVIHLGIPRVVVGMAGLTPEERLPSHQLLLDRGVEVVDLRAPEVMEPMLAYIAAHPADWMEDMGTALDRPA